MNKSMVRVDEDWINDTKTSPVSSVRMFTSESYHRSFWDLAEHGVVLLDKDKNIIEANPYFVQMIGITAADLEGRNIAEIVGGRHWRTDNINLNALVKGAYYSYTNEEEIVSIENGHNELVPVRIIVTRVPSTLTEEFQHFIVQIYKIERAVHINGQPFVNQVNQPFENIFKNLLSQKWFVQTALWIIGILIICLLLSGNLMQVIEKFF
jgi:PAS domain S-box-containing protein